MVYQKKIVITGTGRCGTSFLMHLLTALGEKTGFSVDECAEHLKRSGCNGGIEHTEHQGRFHEARIVKNPDWFYNPNKLNFKIEHIILPIRPIKDVAESRARMGAGVYGGFWQGATNKTEQEEIDRRAFTKFTAFLYTHRLSFSIIQFPELAKDYVYCYKVLTKVFKFDYQVFKRAFNEIANTDLIHV